MDVDFLPKHLVIVGGSYVGLEFGQMYRRFGSEVTIVEMAPRLIGREDEDVSDAVREIMEAEEMQIRLNAKCISLAKRDGGVAVHVTCEDGPPDVVGTHVLVAVGRIPNTSDLGLDRAGIATDRRGYIVDPHDTLVIDGFRTSDADVAAFRFGRVADSFAARTSGDRDVGVVGLAIFSERGAVWTRDEVERRDTANPFPARSYAMPPP